MLVDCDWVDSTTVEIAADDRQPWQQQQFIYEIGELITELNTDQLGRRTTTTTVDDIDRRTDEQTKLLYLYSYFIEFTHQTCMKKVHDNVHKRYNDKTMLTVKTKLL